LILTVIFFMTRVPSVHAQPSITSITPSSGPPGTLVTVTGHGFSIADTGCSVTSSPLGLISTPTPCALTWYQIAGFTDVSISFTVASGATGVYMVTVEGIDIKDTASGSFTVTGAPAPTTIVVPVNVSICVIRLGVEQSGGTVLWLQGYGYPDIPEDLVRTQCQNMTEVLGQDVLGRTWVLHQFIQNRTYYEIVTRYVSS
jgi:hypothetical protein